ncbi:MAG: hypothetical protein ACM3ZF_15485 [Mycobacterium leprae]
MASTPDKPSQKRTTKKAPATTKTTATKPRAARRQAPSHQAIAKRAYEISQANTGGDDLSHWLAAERELTGS